MNDVSCVAAQRAGLMLVPHSAGEEAEQISFCSHCAVAVASHRVDARVCGECGLGLMLSASTELAPSERGAFLVLDGSLSVCAVSRGAEDLLEITETAAVNRHITKFLALADSDPRAAARELAVSVARSVRGVDGTTKLTVRPANTYGVRLSATIGPCGPQPAALLVLEETR